MRRSRASRPGALLILAVAMFAGCSVIGGRPSASRLVTAAPTSAPTASGSPAETPVATATADATAGTGTIFPETFHPDATQPPTPIPTPFPTSQPPGLADLIYALVEELGLPDWCDPDYYPIAHADDIALAHEHEAEMRADEALLETILEHNGIHSAEQLTDEQLVAVYADWKVLTKAIALAPAGDGYTFDYVALRGPQAQQTDYHVVGTISADGQISTTVDESTSAPNCPICLARGTLIETPAGQVPVEQVRVGMVVWTLNAARVRVAQPVLAIGSTPVPLTHRVVHLVLADGRTLNVSPGHPLTDGRLVGALRPGDSVDGSTARSVDLVTYLGGATFDLLPAGGSGAYWANGILLGSTLFTR